ncbi:MAG: sodium:proton exchanger [Flammeovirgaceae bacterium]|nr:sodium:proton exchanger [Flammeovirgaceae bacterium]
MDLNNPYIIIIGLALVIIISFLFDKVAKKTSVPSVLMLIAFGIGIRQGLDYFQIESGDQLFGTLELLGIIGLIMIVLEAALDLELRADKAPVIIKALGVALVALIASSLGIAYLIQQLIIPDFFTSLLYAVPLSIMSSAIIIPSVAGLMPSKREFLIYESALSDILGIMFFYFLLGNAETASVGQIVTDVVINIVVTIVVSIIVSYLLVLLFQNITGHIKLFLLISVLIALYAVGKLFHLSSLMIILVFGLVLNNNKIFFRGKLAKLIDQSILGTIVHEFHTITLETAFVVRTFFFVVFGVTLDLLSLVNIETGLISLAVVAILFAVRLITLKLFALKSIFPELLIAPRGLITILLFFAIPLEFQVATFDKGILLYTILLTALIMMVGLMGKKEQAEDVKALEFNDWEELDKEIEQLSQQKN